jgi:hypothetical protein
MVSIQIRFCGREEPFPISKPKYIIDQISFTLFWYEYRTEGVTHFKNRSVPKKYSEHFAPSIAQAEASMLKKFLHGFSTAFSLFNGENEPAFNVFSCVLGGMWINTGKFKI